MKLATPQITKIRGKGVVFLDPPVCYCDNGEQEVGMQKGVLFLGWRVKRAWRKRWGRDLDGHSRENHGDIWSSGGRGHQTTWCISAKQVQGKGHKRGASSHGGLCVIPWCVPLMFWVQWSCLCFRKVITIIQAENRGCVEGRRWWKLISVAQIYTWVAPPPHVSTQIVLA